MTGLAIAGIAATFEVVTDVDSADGKIIWIGGRTGAGVMAQTTPPLLRLTLTPLSIAEMDVQPASGAWVGEAIGADCPQPPADAGAILCNLMNIPSLQEAEFNAWYDTEHMPSLMALEDVLCAGRFKARQGEPAYAAFYFLKDRSVCQSPLWARTAMTPWTQRIQRYRTDNRRLLFVPSTGAEA